MGRGTLRGATREGEASKAKGRFWGGHPKKIFALFAKSLFGEEPEKQRPAAPQDDGKTPSACPIQRRPHLECREYESSREINRLAGWSCEAKRRILTIRGSIRLHRTVCARIGKFRLVAIEEADLFIGDA